MLLRRLLMRCLLLLRVLLLRLLRRLLLHIKGLENQLQLRLVGKDLHWFAIWVKRQAGMTWRMRNVQAFGQGPRSPPPHISYHIPLANLNLNMNPN